MKSEKYSKSDAFVIDLGKTKIYEYPRLSKAIGLSYFEVEGRRPEPVDKAYLEHDCTFSLFVVEGHGTMTIEGESHSLQKEDLITVLPGNRWFIEGKLSYIVATTPAFYPEQVEEVSL